MLTPFEAAHRSWPRVSDLWRRLLRSVPRPSWVVLPVWFAATSGLRALSLPDEGRYVGVAWEMWRSGHWLIPTLDGLPYFHKPPLFYWLDAAAMALFGASEWAVRFPSMLAASAAAIGFFLFVRRWCDASLASTAVLVLATCPGFFAASQFANHDMLVAAWITGTILLGADALLRAREGLTFRASLAGAFVCAAFGILTKGLIGGVLPALAIAAWLVVQRRASALRLLAWRWGWCLMGFIALPWFGLVEMRHPGFAHYFFIDQQFQRFVGGGFNNVRPWWFYLPVLAAMSFPWCLLVISNCTKQRARPSGSWSDVDILMASWLTVVLIFFSFPQSKLVGYAVPALPPLAFFLAQACGRLEAAARKWPIRTPLALISAALCVALALGVSRFGPHSERDQLRDLHPQIRSTDRILMFDHYVFDAAFYLQLVEPAFVAADWGAARRIGTDGWRRELADAAGFDANRGSKHLIAAGDVPAWLCSQRTRTWVLIDPETARRQPWVARAVRVSTGPKIDVWRFDPAPGDDTDCSTAAHR